MSAQRLFLQLARFRSGFYLLTLWLLAWLDIAPQQIVDPDLWGRLSMGALYFQRGHFPYHDVFSYPFSHTSPSHAITSRLWMDHEWLTGIIFYRVLTHFGEAGFLLFKAGLLLLVFGVVFILHRRVYRVSPFYAFYGFLILMNLHNIGWYSVLRSQIFSFLGFIVFLFCLEQVRTGRKKISWLWILLPLGILWGNLHGGFIMGILLILLYGVGEFFQKGYQTLKSGLHGLVALSILCGTGLFNPYGWSYISFLSRAWLWDRSHIHEWSPLHLESWDFPILQCLLLSILLLLLLRIWALLIDNPSPGATRHPLPQAFITPTLVLVWLVGMTLHAFRMQTFLVLALIAYLPILLPSSLFSRPTLKRHTSLLGLTLPILLFIFSLSSLTYFHHQMNLSRVVLQDEMSQEPGDILRYPLGAIHYLESSPYHGHLMTRFGLGEFAYWRLYPRFTVAMDGRYEEVYSQSDFLKIDAFYNWHNPFLEQQTVQWANQSNTDFILMENKAPNGALLTRSNIWTVLYSDTYFMVLGRNSSLLKYKNKIFVPQKLALTTRVLSIADFITPTDLKRFRNP